MSRVRRQCRLVAGARRRPSLVREGFPPARDISLPLPCWSLCPAQSRQARELLVTGAGGGPSGLFFFGCLGSKMPVSLCAQRSSALTAREQSPGENGPMKTGCLQQPRGLFPAPLSPFRTEKMGGQQGRPGIPVEASCHGPYNVSGSCSACCEFFSEMMCLAGY